MRLPACIAFALAASISAAVAGPLDDLKTCQSPDPDRQIHGCTRLLDFPRLTTAERANVLTFRGIGRLKKGEYDQAIADFTAAIRLNPKLEYPYNNRGNAWYEKKELDLAFADFNEAIRINPKFALPYNGRGNVWWQRGDNEKALADYELALRYDPKLALAYNGKGNMLVERREFDKAMAAYNEALRLSPDLWMALVGRGTFTRKTRITPKRSPPSTKRSGSIRPPPLPMMAGAGLWSARASLTSHCPATRRRSGSSRAEPPSI